MAEDYEDLYDLSNLDDGEIYDLILQELHEYPDLDADLIDIEVQDGFVTLGGRVGTEQELQEIQYVLTDVLGIGNFSNEIVLDELVRAQRSEAADDAVVEEEESDPWIGKSGERTDPEAGHLLEDLEGDLYGTHDIGKAISQGEAYEPPDNRPMQEGSWSEENH